MGREMKRMTRKEFREEYWRELRGIRNEWGR